MQAEAFVTTESCYVGIYDVASPANKIGFMTTELQASLHRARQSQQEEFYGLFHFNEKLLALANQGHLISWTLLFDGVFRVMVEVESQCRSTSAPLVNLGAPFVESTIICPTGQLVISCLSKLGETQHSFCKVEPGIYYIAVERNDAAELEHAFLQSPSEYPSNGGPDWLIRLQPLSGQVQ